MTESIVAFGHDFIGCIKKTGRQLLVWGYLKAFVAVCLIYYSEALSGNVLILKIWGICMIADLMTGVVGAKVAGTYSRRSIGWWSFKAITHLALFLLSGLVCLAFEQHYGKPVYLMDYLVLCCIFTEFCSIVDNLIKLNVPVPKIMVVGLSLFRKAFAKRIADAFGQTSDPRALKEIEDALAARGFQIVKFREEDGDDSAQNNLD